MTFSEQNYIKNRLRIRSAAIRETSREKYFAAHKGESIINKFEWSYLKSKMLNIFIIIKKYFKIFFQAYLDDFSQKRKLARSKSIQIPGLWQINFLVVFIIYLELQNK